jgi:OmpA-OmpF porin, OOP family
LSFLILFASMKRLLSLLGFTILFNSSLAQLLDKNALVVVNSIYDEQSPVLSPDGEFLYFTLAHHPENIGGKKDPGDIWYSIKQDDGTWTTPVHAGATINNKQYNAVAGFSSDGNIMYLHNHYSPTGDAARTQGIAMSRKTENGWSTPENISIPYFQNRSAIPTGSISESGKYFVFAADTYGTYGAEDLYVSTFQNGRWSEPRNLGIIINSAFQEMSPFLAADDKTLYFSTNGRGGKGSFDVYTSTRLDESWTNWSIPQNVSSANSEGRELFFRVDKSGEFALYASTQNSDGYGDIKVWIPEVVYEFEEPTKEEGIIVSELAVVEVPEEKPLEREVREEEVIIENALEKVVISGYIRNKKTSEPVQANISFTNASTQINTTSNALGYFELSADIQQVYRLVLRASGYVNSAEMLENTSNQMQISTEFFLEPVEVGTLVNLKNVLFERSTAKLLSDSNPELDLVAQFMIENPGVEIELAGHTDNRGSQKALMRLSEERVQVVKAYLVERGVDAERINGKGYAGTRPITDNYSEQSRRLNRRVEFTIVKK